MKRKEERNGLYLELEFKGEGEVLGLEFFLSNGDERGGYGLP